MRAGLRSMASAPARTPKRPFPALSGANDLSAVVAHDLSRPGRAPGRLPRTAKACGHPVRRLRRGRPGRGRAERDGRDPVDLWTSPSGRREPSGPCGQPVDNAGRCPPPAPTLTPLAHESHRINTNRFFDLGRWKKETRKTGQFCLSPTGCRSPRLHEQRAQSRLRPSKPAFGRPLNPKGDINTRATEPARYRALRAFKSGRIRVQVPSDSRSSPVGIPFISVGICNLAEQHRRHVGISGAVTM